MKANHICSPQVRSYGTNNHVKMPGPSAAEPNVFEFGTPYADMHAKLQAADPILYTRNGLLKMLERNAAVKPAPERWQNDRCAAATKQGRRSMASVGGCIIWPGG
jgi:RNA polymerase II subunit A C-terminal domain phosphatase SSU72